MQRGARGGAAAGLPVTMLGGGSNVLIADAGLRGLVIRDPRRRASRRLDAHRIRADAGVTINGLVRWTIRHGVAGLEAWAGTPGTVGGAIYGNAHFQGRLIGELVEQRRRWSPRTGEVSDVPAAAMEFGYDYSRLQRTREIVVVGRSSASAAASPTALRARRASRSRSASGRSRSSPPSAGCIFQNPGSGARRVPDGIPPSAGALVDRAGLKGAREGRRACRRRTATSSSTTAARRRPRFAR